MGANTELPTDGQSPTTPFASVAFDLLKDATSRHALYHLHETDGPVELTALAEYVTAAISDSSDCVSAEDVEATCVSLHHSQLPRMEDAGVVEYDIDDSTVVMTGWPKPFESFLSVLLGTISPDN